MKVFVQTKNSLFHDYDNCNAYVGFTQMGMEAVPFETYAQLKQSQREDIVVASLGVVKQRLADFGYAIEPMDYPEELSSFLKRKIWTSTIDEVSVSMDSWPVFVKPKENKVFSGRVVRQIKDLIGCGSSFVNHEVYCSEVLDFVSEYRVFVRYGKILDVRLYHGQWDKTLKREEVEACVGAFHTAPAAYALDFGVTRDGQTALIEVNNTCSIGSYGLDSILYAKFIAARWAELTHTKDVLVF